jgi:hypothetical protein
MGQPPLEFEPAAALCGAGPRVPRPRSLQRCSPSQLSRSPNRMMGQRRVLLMLVASAMMVRGSLRPVTVMRSPARKLRAEVLPRPL